MQLDLVHGAARHPPHVTGAVSMHHARACGYHYRQPLA